MQLVKIKNNSLNKKEHSLSNKQNVQLTLNPVSIINENINQLSDFIKQKSSAIIPDMENNFIFYLFDSITQKQYPHFVPSEKGIIMLDLNKNSKFVFTDDEMQTLLVGLSLDKPIKIEIANGIIFGRYNCDAFLSLERIHKEILENCKHYFETTEFFSKERNIFKLKFNKSQWKNKSPFYYFSVLPGRREFILEYNKVQIKEMDSDYEEIVSHNWNINSEKDLADCIAYLNNIVFKK